MPSFRSDFTSRFVLKNHMAAIVGLTMASGVVADRIAIKYGITRIVFRYPLSVLLGYLVFWLSMRLWLTYLTRSYRPASIITDDLPVEDKPPCKVKSSKGSGWDCLDLDGAVDDACGFVLVLFVILVLVVGGSAFILISEAPLILTEVAFQFFLSAGLLKSAKRIDSPSWMGSVLKHTWKPFALVFLTALLFGGWAEFSCKDPTSLIKVVTSCRN